MSRSAPNSAEASPGIVFKIVETVILVPFAHLIISVILVAPVTTGIFILAPHKDSWSELWLAPMEIGVATAVVSFLTTVSVGLPVICAALRAGLTSKRGSAVTGAICALPVIVALLYFIDVALVLKSSLDTAILIALNIHAALLGALGGLLARYIWLPDRVP